MRRLFTVLLVFLMSGVVWGQILTFEFAGIAGNEETVGSNYNDVALTASNISRGAGLNASANGDRFNATHWTEVSLENSIAVGDYMEFTITPQDDNEFNVTSIYLQLQRSGTGPLFIALRNSTDNFASDLDQVYDIDNITTTQNFTFTFDQGASSSDVTYRIYKWGASATNGSSGIGDGAGNDLVVYGDIIEPEPTNHVDNFAAIHNGTTQVDLTWTDNDGAQAADGFLILANTTGTFADPVDGTPQADDTDLSDDDGQVNVAHGVETYSFTGLTPETQYFFKIYPYTNSGSSIDYKTDGTVPTANATPTTLLLVENFDYAAGTLLTDNGWTAHSGAGTQAITVNNGGLTFADYPSSGIGNAALVDNNGEDVNRTFAEVTSGALYVSFLVNVTSISNGYFFHIATSGVGTLRGKVFISEDSGNLKFGLSKGANLADDVAIENYSTSTTYLLVLKYEIIDGASNDEVSLFVFESDDDFSSEPLVPTIGPLTDATLPDISPGSVALRQYNASQNIIVDGIRVATSWGQAPLPVELTTFAANVFDGKVNLSWATATEVDNYGFEILRHFAPQNDSHSESVLTDEESWETIGFVEGHGNSNSPKNYSYTDEITRSGKYSYRLKQIDTDGSFEYSGTVTVSAEDIIPDKFDLFQNYPNPFNPVTKIKFALPQSETQHSVSLRVYDIIGREVAVLVNESKEAGIYEVTFDASKLSSGLYFYSLNAAGKTITKKMMLLR